MMFPLTPFMQREFAFAADCGRDYPKSWYQVFLCSDAADHWSYNEDKILFESDDMSKVHGYAYEAWLASGTTKVYTIIQPYDGSCRGGYGFEESE